ncbi:MAG: hypothetical protein J5778_00060 [Clostridiales bacterium]|nr:hypothetical protein [Clostridiales bacterium]
MKNNKLLKMVSVFLILTMFAGMAMASSSSGSSKKDDSSSDSKVTSDKDNDTEDTTKKETEETTTTETTPEDNGTVEIIESGYSIGKLLNSPYCYWGVVYKNTSTTHSYNFTKINVTAYDKDGDVIATDSQTMSLIRPGETIAFGDGAFDLNDEKPDKVEFEIDPGDEDSIFGALTEAGGVAVSELELSQVKDKTKKKGYPVFTGKITNNSENDTSLVAISVILKKDGKIVGGTVSYVRDLNAGSTKAFEVKSLHKFKYDSFEVYAYDWL